MNIMIGLHDSKYKSKLTFNLLMASTMAGCWLRLTHALLQRWHTVVPVVIVDSMKPLDIKNSP